MVEWKKLGKICEIKGRIGFRGYTRDDQVDKGKGAISLSPGNIDNGSMNYESCTYITWEKYEESPEIMVNEGDIILCKTASVGKVARIKKLPEKATINPQLVLIKNISTNPQYLFYVLDDQPFQSKIKGLSGIGSVPNVSQAKLSDILIPIPSLEEQTRIVGILDTFTSAIDNLKEQIAQRIKQYEYYCDQLLDLEGKPEQDIHCWGEFCKMEKGNGVQKVDFVEKGIGCIHYGQIYTHYGSYAYETNKFVSEETFAKAKKASKGDVILTDTSENVEDICKSVAWLGDDDIAVSNHALIIKHNQNPKFLSYSTQTNSFFLQKRKVVVGVKVSGIKPDDLAKIKIFLPSLSEQQRIVSILDTFEASIQNLEAQLKQREKQYEYYRNKLLTFE